MDGTKSGADRQRLQARGADEEVLGLAGEGVLQCLHAVYAGGPHGVSHVTQDTDQALGVVE
ncbi:MAG: hypothetical protein U5L11_05320 [Arhodomonas sp.]|nr:hypothetical protein [Arhodomonas sp.]